jgi:hypothetical protein
VKNGETSRVEQTDTGTCVAATAAHHDVVVHVHATRQR